MKTLLIVAALVMGFSTANANTLLREGVEAGAKVIQKGADDAVKTTRGAIKKQSTGASSSVVTGAAANQVASEGPAVGADNVTNIDGTCFNRNAALSSGQQKLFADVDAKLGAHTAGACEPGLYENAQAVSKIVAIKSLEDRMAADILAGRSTQVMAAISSELGFSAEEVNKLCGCQGTFSAATCAL